jgi:hypothetical protein
VLARAVDRGSAIDGLGVLRPGGHHALQRGLAITGSEPQGPEAGWARSVLSWDQQISHGGQIAMGWLAWS